MLHFVRVWAEIQRRSENWRIILDIEVHIEVNFIIKNNTSDNVCFLFCIDEARALISPSKIHDISLFRLFRRVLRKVKVEWVFYLTFGYTKQDIKFCTSKIIRSITLGY